MYSHLHLLMGNCQLPRTVAPLLRQLRGNMHLGKRSQDRMWKTERSLLHVRIKLVGTQIGMAVLGLFEIGSGAQGSQPPDLRC